MTTPEGPWRPSHYRLTPIDRAPDETVQQVYTVARHTKGLTVELNMHRQARFPVSDEHHLLTITVDGQPGVWMELGAMRNGHGWYRHLDYNYGTGRTSTDATHRRIQGVFDYLERAARRHA